MIEARIEPLPSSLLHNQHLQIVEDHMGGRAFQQGLVQFLEGPLGLVPRIEQAEGHPGGGRDASAHAAAERFFSRSPRMIHHCCATESRLFQAQ